MAIKGSTWTRISGIFCAIFIVLGILNAFFVHIVPGFFYLLLAFIYYPPAHSFLKKTFRLTVAPLLKTILGLVVLWGTLAVGDLMEMFEAWYLR